MVSALRAWRHGPADAPLVVFIHGGWMDHRMFDQQIHPVLSAGFQILTWDLRGHGCSGPIGTPPPTVADMASDLIALLDDLDHAEPVWLVGQSLGGMIAQRAALAEPGRVAGLVTIGAPCIAPGKRRTRLVMAAMWRVQGHLAGLLPISTIRRQLPAGTAVEPEVQEYVRAAVERMTKHEFRWLVNASRRAGEGLSGASSRHPTLITRGELDTSGAGRMTKLTVSDWLAANARARFAVIPGAGHQAHQDRPETFNRLLLDFLADPGAR